MERKELIAYSMDFASFLVKSNIGKSVKRIILFGSVARGDFDKKSDIDIFIDTSEDVEKDIKNVLSLFFKSSISRQWELKGLKHEISLKIGNLNEWVPLKRSIISSGIMLYGRFKDIPDKMEHYRIFELSFDNFKRKKKVMLWRKLYGYKQKVKGKEYISKGYIDKYGVKRLEKVLIVPNEDSKAMLDFLNKEKINYTIREVWSDNI